MHICFVKLNTISLHEYFPASAALAEHRVLQNSSLFYYFDEVNCMGNEIDLTECIQNGIGRHDCSETYEQAGVICNSMYENLSFHI